MIKSFLSTLILFGYVQCKVLFSDSFETDPFETKRWVVSANKQDTGEAGKLEYSGGLWGAGERKGIRTTQDAKFYSFSTKLPSTLNFDDKTLAFGFRVKHEQKMDCGGGYAKLMSPKIDQSTFNGDTPYSIMFGPDICGYSTKKVHTIFNFGEKNLEKKQEVTCPDDEYTHSYALVLNPDSTYAIYVDAEEKAKGNLKDDWEFEKPKKIKDPEAKKPDDWVDEEMIDDPDDKKPDDWDAEPQKIPDPDASKPDDWDDEEDGEWEAPKIDNPKYKGEWKPKKIKNPKYVGPWEHPEIDNPEWVEVQGVHKRGDIGAIGIEVWQVKSGTVFSDFVLADSYDDVKKYFEDRVVNVDDEKEAKKQLDEEKTKKEEAEKKEKGEEKKTEEEEDEEGEEKKKKTEEEDKKDEEKEEENVEKKKEL